MSDIPSELFHNILRRVPADSLLLFRTVCKEWRRLIDDPSIIRCHANSQVSSTTLIIRGSNGTRIYSLALDSINYNSVDAHQMIDIIPGKTVYLIGVYQISHLPVVSCNGLMLHKHYETKEDWVILNPLTRQLHVLPQADIDRFGSGLIGDGLGYDCASDDYKVVRIDHMLRHDKTVYVTSVYSLKMESWKMIEECPPCDFPKPSQKRGVFLNGALHWRSEDFIIALNLKTEGYHKLPLPPILGRPVKMRLDVLGGCLVLSYYYLKKHIDGWVMKDFGVEKFWVKLFSFGDLANIGARGSLKPLAYIQSKGQVFLKHDRGFFMLDIAKNSAKNVTINGLPKRFKRFTCQIFPGSFIPLDHSYGIEVNSSVVWNWERKRTKASRRVKYPVTITDVLSRSEPSWSNEDDV